MPVFKSQLHNHSTGFYRQRQYSIDIYRQIAQNFCMRIDISVRLDHRLRDRIKRAAEIEGRTMSNMVRVAIIEYLDRCYPVTTPTTPRPDEVK